VLPPTNESRAGDRAMGAETRERARRGSSVRPRKRRATSRRTSRAGARGGSDAPARRGREQMGEGDEVLALTHPRNRIHQYLARKRVKRDT